MDNKTIITPSKSSNNSITTSKPTSLCPFCHNFEKTAKIDEKNFCKKHSTPYSCLVPKCYSVCPSKDILIHHYRSHLNLDSHSYLCHICFGILDCSRSDSKKKHTHQDLVKLLTCCSTFFPTMTDFVCHKLLEHNGSIISRKSNINPLNQNLKRPRRNKRFRALRSKRAKVDKIIDTPKLPETPNSGFTGIYVCKLCPTVYPTLSDFVEHSEKSHDIPYQLKENEIKLCPLCDENYDILNFVEHIAKCTNTMKVGDDSLNQYGCVHCQQIFSGMTASQFRNHFNYCRSFEVDGIDDNSEKSRRCKNCMFESTNLENCIKHANSYCIYYKLKMKYAKESYEKDKVMEREISQKQTANDISLVFIKPENASDSVKINPSYCDWSRQKILETFSYYCNSCDKGFFSLNVFRNHLSCKGVKCRPNSLLYCIRCVSDFDSVVSFNTHLPSVPPMPSSVPITYTETGDSDISSHKPFIEIHSSKSIIKVESSNYELNETTHFYNEEEDIVMDPIVVSNNANNLQLDDDNEEIENLENNDSTLFQESEDFKTDIKSVLFKESKDSIFDHQLFHEIEASDVDLQSIVKIDENKPNVINSLDSSA